MFNIYKEDNLTKKLIESNLEDLNNENFPNFGSWISTNYPTRDNLEFIANKSNISFDFLLTSLDEEEAAHVDVEDDSVLIVLDVPYFDEEKNMYFTKPFTICYNENYYVTVSKYNKTLIPATLLKTKGIEPQKHVRLTLNIIYQLSKEFIYTLKKIDEKTKEIEDATHTSMKNKELFELMDLSKSLVYFATALNSNKTVLQRLLKSPRYKKFEDDMELMEDTEIELNQAIEMCNIYRGILNAMMDANASIINNNLNDVMKTLTTITIVISIPTLITSIFGMNFADSNSPLYYNKYGFYIVLGVAFILSILFAIILLYFTNRKNRR